MKAEKDEGWLLPFGLRFESAQQKNSLCRSHRHLPENSNAKIRGIFDRGSVRTDSTRLGTFSAIVI